jgi:Ser/Thr protein kinase RdoA (MazF antagonist)
MFAEEWEHLEPEAAAALRDAIGRGGGWVDDIDHGAVVCHGDVHPGNVMMTARGPVLLDWDLLCRAHPAWDHAPMMTWADRWGGAPGDYEAFARGYGASFRDDPLGETLAELRLVAATLMRSVAARADPAAREELQRRLRWWRGDPDAPAWRPQ